VMRGNKGGSHQRSAARGASWRAEEWGFGDETWGKRSTVSRGLATQMESENVGQWRWLADGGSPQH
jgi:hypothetical protein